MEDPENQARGAEKPAFASPKLRAPPSGIVERSAGSTELPPARGWISCNESHWQHLKLITPRPMNSRTVAVRIVRVARAQEADLRTQLSCTSGLILGVSI